MKRIHALIIALALAAAVIAGTFAAMRTTQLASPAAPRVSNAALANQERALNRAQAALRSELRRKPPALPKLAPAAAASVVAAQPQQTVVYHRAPPIVHVIHRKGGGEGGSERDGGGGGVGADD